MSLSSKWIALVYTDKSLQVLPSKRSCLDANDTVLRFIIQSTARSYSVHVGYSQDRSKLACVDLVMVSLLPPVPMNKGYTSGLSASIVELKT